MQMPPRPGRPGLTQRHRYKQVLPPLLFPEEEHVNEGDLHLDLRLLLRGSLRLHLADAATVGSDQFVYWNARDPKRCLAPDTFVKFGPRLHQFRSWKIWEHGGPPEVCVEITSPWDGPPSRWSDKLERYAELGVRELVRFHADAPPEDRLRIWDRVDDNLLERETADRAEWSDVLDLWWVLTEHPDFGLSLRLAHDPAAQRLLLTPHEAVHLAHQAEQRAHQAEQRAHQAEHRARQAAEQRVQELEAELKRRGE